MADQRNTARRVRLLRTVLGRSAVYATLIGVALIMLFPFAFMVAGALKTTEDTFRYPPKFLPLSAAVETVNGEQQDLYRIEAPGRGETAVYLSETGVAAGLFMPVGGNESDQIAWPLDLAIETSETVEIDGSEVVLYDVTFGDEVRTLGLLRETVVGRFVGVDDASIETFAVPRTAMRDEFVVFTPGTRPGCGRCQLQPRVALTGLQEPGDNGCRAWQAGAGIHGHVEPRVQHAPPAGILRRDRMRKGGLTF